jgi:hypothetical protein
MSKAEGNKPVSKRFFVDSTVDVQKALMHLAIDLDTSSEKLAGYILADVVARARANPEALRRLLPREKRE